MTEDVQLHISNNKLPAYEQIDGSAPPRRKRVAYLLAAVGLVLTIVTVGVYSASNVAGAAGSPGLPNARESEETPLENGACGLSGSGIRTINIAGVTRSYKYVVPAVSFPTSLIVAYHGIASDVNKIEGKMQLQTSSAASTSILVYPEAKNKGGSILDPAAFNGAGCCKDSPDFKDEDFFAAIVGELTAMGCVDAAKVYVMGFSNGGFMTNRLACAEATNNLVAAACVHSGLIGDYGGVLENSPWMHCAAKPVLSIHGTADTTVPIGGGKNPLNAARWFSQDQVIEMWANAGRCVAPTVLTTGSKTRSNYVCGSHSVASIKHEGFGHDWHIESTEDCVTWFNDHGRLA
jgi:polyhydroxybutyrate depolymerase